MPKGMHEPILKKTAVALGGDVAALASSVTSRIRKGVGRIPTKNKTRLPRREKKALAKAALPSAARASLAKGKV